MIAIHTSATVLIAGMLCLAPAGTACAESVKEEITVSTVRDVTPQESQTISRAAAKTLRCIAEARDEIKSNQADQAAEKIGQCLRLIAIIKDTVPVVKVKDHIRVAKKHLSYQDTETVKADLAPIYASLDEIADIVPVDEARHHIDTAQESLKKKDKAAAEQAFAMAEGSLSYCEVDLPVGFTEDHVNAAKKFLADGDMQKAEKALQAAEAGVLFVSVDIYSPIILAKHTMSMAMRDYLAGSYEKAGKDMQAVQYYLAKAAASADAGLTKEAEKISGAITPLLEEMKSGGKDITENLKGLFMLIDIAGTQRMVLKSFKKHGRN